MYNPSQTQFGKSHSADFETNTWTFLMPDKYEVGAGEFVIKCKKDFDDLLKAGWNVLDQFSYNGQLPQGLANALNDLHQLLTIELNVQASVATESASNSNAD